MRWSWDLCLGGDRADLIDSVLNVSSNIGREDGTSIHRLGH